MIYIRTGGMILSMALIFFPSCIHYYEISKREFPQGKKRDDRTEKLVQQNLKTARVYDQFETEAIFDCLWMSNDLSVAFQNLHSNIKGKNEKSRNALIRRDFEENRHWITFYLLADIRDKLNKSLTDSNSAWSLYLKFGSTKVSPISIKEIELQPEIKKFFGSRMSRFKSAYHIKFPASDIDGNSYLRKFSKMELIFNSASKWTSVSWSRQDNKNELEKMRREGVKNEEDYYWI